MSKPNCAKGCGLSKVPNQNANEKRKCTVCGSQPVYPDEIWGCFLCWYYLCSRCYHADESTRAAIQSGIEERKTAEDKAKSAAMMADAAEREEKAKRATANAQAECKIREQKAAAEIEKNRKAQQARLKAEQDERDRVALQAKRQWEKEQEQLKNKRKQDQIAWYEKKIESVGNDLSSLNHRLELAKTQKVKMTENLKATNDKIKSYPERLAAQQKELRTMSKSGLDDAEKEMAKGEKEIESAIKKTGMQEQNVVKFLGLAAQMSGETLNTTGRSNQLNAALSCFGDLIGRKCRTKLLIETYAESEAECLAPFVSAFKSEGYVKMKSLKCKNQEEFDEILAIAEKEAQRAADEEKAAQGTAQENTANEEQETKEPNDDRKEEKTADPDDADDAEPMSAEELLTKYKLQKFWPKFEEEGWDDVQDWHEMTADDLKELGIKGGNAKKWNRLAKELKGEPIDDEPESTSLLNNMQKRCLKEICFSPDEWQHLEDEQDQTAREDLDGISDLLSVFFSRIHGGISQARELLDGFSSELNGPQKKAIKAAVAASADEKDDVPSDDAKDYDAAELAKRNAWKAGDQCEVYSKSNSRWLPATIASIEVEEDGDECLEWLVINNDLGTTARLGRLSQRVRTCAQRSHKVVLTSKDLALQDQNESLLAASVVAINVTKSMAKQFDANTITLQAKTIAESVEDCCCGIIQSQAAIRQAVMMVDEIRDLRPAHLDKDAEPVWDAMKEGSKSILKQALKMTQVSAEYFGFFLKFQNSFRFYQSNSSKTLTISTQHLIKDCKNFQMFNSDFTETVMALNEEASRVLTACVDTVMGASNFKIAQELRAKRQQIYLDAKKEYDTMVLDWQSKHGIDVLTAEKIKFAAGEAEQTAKVEHLTADHTRCNEMKTKLERQLANLV